MPPGAIEPAGSPVDPASAIRTADLSPELLDEDEGGLDIRRYVSALLRYKWMILALAAMGLASGVGVSKFVKPIYDSQASFQIDLLNRSAGNQASPIRETQVLQARAWIDLLRSFTVLDEVVRRRRLFVEYESAEESRFFENFEVGTTFTPGVYALTVNAEGTRVSLATAAGRVIDERALGDSIGRIVGFRWVPSDLSAGRTLNFVVRTPREAAVRLSQALTIPPLPQDASFLRMSIRGTDPVGITATVNAIAQRFVEVATFLKRDKLTQVTAVLRAQLDRSQADLRDAENSLERYKVNTITLPTDRGASPIVSGLTETRDPVRLAFFSLRLKKDSLATERDAIRRALRVAPDSNTSLLIVLGSIPSVVSSAELNAALTLLASKRTEARQLRLAFGPGHLPLQEIDREIRELETTTVPTQARAVAANLDQRVSDLEERIAASAREMQEIPARVSEEARLERNVFISNNLYTALQAAYEEARLAELSAAPDVRVLDAAEIPNQPVTDQLLLIVAGGLLGGAGLGLFLALALDRFDPRIRYPEQITRGLGLSILGAIPMMHRNRSGKSSPEQTSQLLEAMRTIRMNLSYAHGTAGTFITTITSPGAGDGKSFTAANLARGFASAGLRTLLIDADTRRGLLHHTLEVQRKPGLLDFLGGTATRAAIIRTVPTWGVDFIACGTRKSGGPELLASPPMAQLLMGLRGEYQAIVIDSPPIGAGVDALVLASLCGSLVMVLRTGVTDREFAESRLHDLQRLPIRVLGAVLNDVRPEGVYRYYSYLPGYRSEDEVIGADEPKSSKRLTGGSR